MTEKWGPIQEKWDLVRVSRGVRVIRVRVTGVLLLKQYSYESSDSVPMVSSLWGLFLFLGYCLVTCMEFPISSSVIPL